LSQLTRPVSGHFGRRKVMDRVMTVVAYACAALAIIPLTWIVIYVLIQGLSAWNVRFFTHLPTTYEAGGVRNGIFGTIEVVGLSILIGVPVGVMAGIFLAEYGSNALGAAIRFTADTLSGVPSIVVGLFVYGLIVLNTGGAYSAVAGAVALSILMIPIITRTTEEIIRLVPGSIREASLALGVPRWKTILRVVVPTAMSGIVTGVFLAVARIAGETAPLIMTIFGTTAPISRNIFNGPTTTLSLLIYQLGGASFPEVVKVAWGAALLLILIVFGLSIVARALFKGEGTKF
jgi:phosphate transport system permease protein